MLLIERTCFCLCLYGTYIGIWFFLPLWHPPAMFIFYLLSKLTWQKKKITFSNRHLCNFKFFFHTRRNHFWKVLYIACGADKQRAKKRKLQGILYTKKSWKALPARSLFTNGTELRVHSIFDFQIWLSEQSTDLNTTFLVYPNPNN